MTDDKNPTMHDIPDHDRPRERLFSLGAKSLSDSELLAILIGSGTKSENALIMAQRIITNAGGLLALARTPATELSQQHGLGRAKSAKIIAALELGHRLSALPPEARPQILSAIDAVSLMRDMNTLTQEHVRVMLLDTSRRIINTITLYIGTVNASVIRVSEVYREAVIRNSPAIILIHNHPSGDASPSPEDIELTRALVAAGRLMDIQLLDHIIIAGQKWTSLRDLNLGFEAN